MYLRSYINVFVIFFPKVFGAVAGHEPQMLATIPVEVAKMFAVGNKLICLGSQGEKMFVLDLWNPKNVDVRGKEGVRVTSLCTGRSDFEGDQYKLRSWV